MKILVLLAGVLALSAQQPTSNPGFRLGYVLKVHVAALGTNEAAMFVRDQLAGAILNRTRLQLESDPSRADAVLIGTAIVTSGYQHWAVGSRSSSSATAAVASAGGSASAAAASADGRFSAGGGTVRITELGLQLADPDGRILWAYDRSRCLDVTTLVLIGVPRNRSTTVCAAEQLAKAIDKDAKAARHR
jgi:hypothetical protein